MSQIREREQDAEELLSLDDEFPYWFDEDEMEEADKPKETRGRPRIQERWTRCISL